MIIDTPEFRITARKMGLISRVTFSNINYERGTFKKIIGAFTFISMESPAYYRTQHLYLPGTNRSHDNSSILVPTRLLECIKKWLNGEEAIFAVTGEEAQALLMHRERNILAGAYSYNDNHPRTCKEQVCYQILQDKSEPKKRLLSLGVKLSKEQIVELKRLIRKLPPEAQISCVTEKGCTTLVFQKWWQDYYRIGWLLNQVRIIHGERCDPVYRTDYYKKRSQDFVNGKHTLSEQTQKLWSYNVNWVRHAKSENHKAFDL